MIVIPAAGLREQAAEPGASRSELDASKPSRLGKARAMVARSASIAVYIMASARNGTLYIGVTSELQTRDQQHKLGTFDGFSKIRGCKTLVWYEQHATMLQAIDREKRIKRWRRAWKLALIEELNPAWRDLSDPWFEAPDGPLSWAQPRKDDGGF